MARWRSVGLSAAATPSRDFKRGKADDPSVLNKNSWERGVAMDTRGPVAVPYLDPQGQPIGSKRWGETYRRQFQDAGLA